MASAALGMGPSHTMSVAERLYLGGLITYPRTESTSYPGKFEFKAIIQALTEANQEIQAYAQKLLKVFQISMIFFNILTFCRMDMKNQELESMLETILLLLLQPIPPEIYQVMKLG